MTERDDAAPRLFELLLQTLAYLASRTCDHPCHTILLRYLMRIGLVTLPDHESTDSDHRRHQKHSENC